MGHKPTPRHLLTRRAGAIALAGALAALAAPVYGAASTWVGGTGNWNDTGNWSFAIPSEATIATIDALAGTGAQATISGIPALVGELHLAVGDRVNISNGSSLKLHGNATIDGTLALQSSGLATFLFAQNDVTLSGIGTVALGNNSSNQVYAHVHPVDGPRRITIGTLSSNLAPLLVGGAGSFGLGLTKFTNYGTVEANQSLALVIKPSSHPDAFINLGRLQANLGGTLQLDGPTSTYTNTGGLIQALDGSVVSLSPGVNIVGGTLGATGTGQVRTTGQVTFESVTLGGGTLNVLPGSTLDIKGALINKGAINLGDAASPLADFQYFGNVTIAGGGTIVLKGGANSRIYGKVDAVHGVGRLTIGPEQTIRGTGSIGAAERAMITNEGKIIADQATALTIDVTDSSDFLQRGSLQVQQNSTLKVAAGANFIQDAATASTWVAGTLEVPVYDLRSGEFSGPGTFTGVLANSGGTVSPGNSPGKLTISGNYSQGENASLLIELNGIGQGTSYDLLQVSGDAELGGTLDLRFGFIPTVGASFTVLTAGGKVSGAFHNIIEPLGWEIDPAYNGKEVTLTIMAVPEPETYALMLSGLGLIAWAVKRRQRRVLASRSVRIQSS